MKIKSKRHKMCVLNLNFKIIKTIQKQLELNIKQTVHKKIKFMQIVFKNSLKNVTLKAQQRFKSESYNVFTEEINKIALKSNDDERMQSIDSIETYAYGTSNDLEEEIKCNNTIK